MPMRRTFCSTDQGDTESCVACLLNEGHGKELTEFVHRSSQFSLHWFCKRSIEGRANGMICSSVWSESVAHIAK
jgi:hypothetical protein